jgi:DNA-binding transcriptional MocR family regulator
LAESGLVTAATPRISATSLARRLGSRSSDGSPPATSPAYRELARQIRAAVLDGRLPVSTGLPSERELAGGLGLSRTTVAAAYSLLREQGWLESRRGSGSRVTLPDRTRVEDAHRPRGSIDGLRSSGPETIDLTTASVPAPSALATAVRAAADALGSALEPGRSVHLGLAPGDGYHPFGLPALRHAIAEKYSAAGLPTTADEILVTNGAQHSLSLAMAELSNPGDRVMIECPTYPVALDAIRATRRIPAPFGVTTPPGDDTFTGSWDLELIGAALRQTAPRLAYLIPDFQNPTGAVMSADDRAALVAAADRSGTVLLADESFRDVPFPDTGALPPPLSAFGDSTRVLSLGSVSKAFWGGLRVGWIRAAPPLIRRLAAARALGDMAGPVIEQLVVTELLADPAPVLTEQRARLAAGAAAAHAMLAEYLPGWQATRPSGGASLWVRLPGPFATDLARVAPTVGVRIAPGPRFGPDGTMESYLRLPFTAEPDRLRAAGPRLALAVERATRLGGGDGLPDWVT